MSGGGACGGARISGKRARVSEFANTDRTKENLPGRTKWQGWREDGEGSNVAKSGNYELRTLRLEERTRWEEGASLAPLPLETKCGMRGF